MPSEPASESCGQNSRASSRARSLVFYLAAFDGKAELLNRLGKHQVRGSCLHIARLADVDLDVLGDILRRAFLHDADETSA